MKVCKRCNETKEIKDFYKDKKSSDGHNAWCATCCREYNKNYQNNWRANRKDLLDRPTKICAKCKEVQPVDNFAWAADRTDYRQAYCKKCKSYNYQKLGKNRVIERTKNNRRKIREEVDQYKLQTGCLYCKYNKCARSLHFHHPDDVDKSFNISSAISRNLSIKNVWAELQKCIVVCANCHGEIHEGVLNE